MDESGPKLFVRAFGGFSWGATDEAAAPNSFALGQFAIFATAPLSERVSVLAEIVLEASVDTRVVTDLERLQLTYRFDDRLHLSAGRYHTGIGYYNSAFHHGSYFETPIGRPRVFAFEDEGGVLPVHDLGLVAAGAIPRTGGAFSYKAEVGNGRSWRPEGTDGEAVLDTNDAKSTNVAVTFRPERFGGLRAGASFYRDTIARESGGAIRHRIGTAYVVYKTESIEILGEWLSLWHRTPEGLSYTNRAGYVQASKAWGKLRPYYRYDRLTVDPATPLIGATESAGGFSTHILGLRVDPGPWFGLKAQYERTRERGRSGIDTLRTQLVFVF